MEGESGFEKETKVIFQAPIFHFRDVGERVHPKGKLYPPWNY